MVSNYTKISKLVIELEIIFRSKIITHQQQILKYKAVQLYRKLFEPVNGLLRHLLRVRMLQFHSLLVIQLRLLRLVLLADLISGGVGKPVIAVSSHLQRTSCLLQHLKPMLSAFFFFVWLAHCWSTQPSIASKSLEMRIFLKLNNHIN